MGILSPAVFACSWAGSLSLRETQLLSWAEPSSGSCACFLCQEEKSECPRGPSRAAMCPAEERSFVPRIEPATPSMGVQCPPDSKSLCGDPQADRPRTQAASQHQGARRGALDILGKKLHTERQPTCPSRPQDLAARLLHHGGPSSRRKGGRERGGGGEGEGRRGKGREGGRWSLFCRPL